MVSLLTNRNMKERVLNYSKAAVIQERTQSGGNASLYHLFRYVQRSITGLSLCFLFQIVSSTFVRAQVIEPTAGFYSYHQLRVMNGTGGSGYGLDGEGNYSLTGPVAYTTPVAYTLGHRHLVFGGGQHSFSGRPIFSSAEGNWGAFATYGDSFGKWNFAVTDDVVDVQTLQLFNVQAQYVPPIVRGLRISGGILDLFDSAKSYNQNYKVISSFTYFGVATYEIPLKGKPLYLSLGAGSRRYGKGFGSLSYQFLHPLRGWVEADRYSVNTGIQYSTKVGHGRRGVPFNMTMGAARLRYFLFGVTIGF